MTVYVVVLAELAMLILFYGQTQQSTLTKLWAQLVDVLVVVLVKKVSVSSFQGALLNKNVMFRERMKVLKMRERKRLKTQWSIWSQRRVSPLPESGPTGRRGSQSLLSCHVDGPRDQTNVSFEHVVSALCDFAAPLSVHCDIQVEYRAASDRSG